MKAEDNPQQNQELVQLTDQLARLLLTKTGKTIDVEEELPDLIELLKRNLVTSIALAVILPADGGTAQIVYLDKHSDAYFRIPFIDPSSFSSSKWQSLRQGSVRREAAKAVRHQVDHQKQADSFQAHAATLKSACLTNASPWEQSIGARYIHAGEFAWLCLLWLWTGEPEDRATFLLSENRSVVLEQLSDTKNGKGPLLLSKLHEIEELKTEFKILYGELQQGEANEYWKRSSKRLQDFEKLGFVISVGENSKQLTKKAGILTSWLSEARQILVSEKNDATESQHKIERLQALLDPSAKANWLTELDAHAKQMSGAFETNDASAWSESLNSLLNAFSSQTERNDFREFLRTDGFPVYPLVHLTLLLGLEAHLDWLAIPLGAMVPDNNSQDTREQWPQAAAFVLAQHREPAMVERLVSSLRPILTAIAFVESGSWSRQMLEEERRLLTDLSIRAVDEVEGFVAVSPKTKQFVLEVMKAANTTAPILLIGETGSGKGATANLIHTFSKRKQCNFVTVRFAEIPETLIETELFGYAPLSGIHGADPKGKAGKFEIANNGTLFLDEIGDIPLDMQAKILGVLQDGKFARVGSNTTIKADLRIISATNRDIETLIETGLFRQDLKFRINTVEIECPPLRERQEDILPIVQHVFRKTQGMKKTMQVQIESNLARALCAYSWPGNVRELEKAIEYAAQQQQVHNDYLDWDALPNRLANTLRGVCEPKPTSAPGKPQDNLDNGTASAINKTASNPLSERQEYKDLMSILKYRAGKRAVIDSRWLKNHQPHKYKRAGECIRTLVLDENNNISNQNVRLLTDALGVSSSSVILGYIK